MNLKEELAFKYKHISLLSDPVESEILKLHGSLTWFVCTNSYCHNHMQVYSMINEVPKILLEKSLKKFTFYRNCRNCSSPLEEVIIYPGMIKRYEKFPKIGHLWNLASRVLTRAQRIVIIGYSFRPQDVATTFLVKSSLLSTDNSDLQLIIVDKDSNLIKTRLKKLLPTLESKVDKCTIHKDVAEFMSSTGKLNP
jgi:NAD-dependent SIR2 family protein deacetylase